MGGPARVATFVKCEADRIQPSRQEQLEEAWGHRLCPNTFLEHCPHLNIFRKLYSTASLGMSVT